MPVQVRVRPRGPYLCPRDGVPPARRRGRPRAALGAVARAGRGGLRGRRGRPMRPRRWRSAEQPPDGLVIDIGLPDADGRDVCQALRARGVDAPVLFLTARDAVTDRLAGFSAGGDDYVTKPFHFDELVARLRALLRRSGADASTTIGALRLDPGGARDQRRRTARLADADRVPRCWRRSPASPAPCCAGASSSARRGPRARSCTTTRSTSTWRGCGASCARLAAQATIETVARGRLPAAMRRFRTLRGRLTALGLLAALAAVAVLTVAFNVILDRSLNADANGRARSLATAAAATVEYENGHLRVHESVDDAIVDRRVWVYDGHARHRAPARDGRAAAHRRRARRVARTCSTTCPAATCACTPRRCSSTGARSGTVVAAQSLAAYDRTTDLALLGSVVLAARAARRGRRPDLDHGRARARPGARDDRVGGGLERARSRPSASAPRRVPTSSASWRAPSTRCWTAWPRACATSSACRPSSRTSCARRWRGSWPRSSCCSAASARPRIAARPTPSSPAAPSR